MNIYIMTENEIGKIVVDSIVKVHKSLGPGLLEHTYECCLAYELMKSGLKVEQQRAMPLIYDDIKLDAGYRLDILVENKVIIEVKSVEMLNRVHEAQLLTYLKISDCKLGYLVNFNVELAKYGIKRYANGL